MSVKVNIDSTQEKHTTLTAGSGIKAAFVFVSTIALYYLAKATDVFSYFGWRSNEVQSLGGRQILEVKNGEASVALQKSIEKVEQANILSTVQGKQVRQNDPFVEFKEIEVEDLPERRSISIQNPIPDQTATAGNLFELIIDGDGIFSSNISKVILEATNLPNWLDSSALNATSIFESSYSTPGMAKDIVASESYVYIADGSGLQIIDVTDPSNPVSVGSNDTPGWAIGIDVSGNYAYVADWYFGLRIMDITNVSDPTVVGLLPTDQPWGIDVYGDYAFIADDESGLKVVDVTDPSNPALTGSCSTYGWSYGVAVSGDYAYLVDGSDLRIIDVSNPNNPTLIRSYNPIGWSYDVDVAKNYVYIAASTMGLRIVDVTDPMNPTFAGSYNTPHEARDVVVSGNYAYIADGYSGMHIVDVADPFNPIHQAAYNTSDGSEGVAVSGNYVYVADGFAGMQVIALRPHKLMLSGIPDSVGIHNVVINACNQEDCISESFDISVENNAPIVLNHLHNQTVVIGNLFSYIFSNDTFVDPDGNRLTYIAELINDKTRPSWLSFSSFQRKFFGTPTMQDTYHIKVIANDGYGGNVSSTFYIDVKDYSDSDVMLTVMTSLIISAIVCATGICGLSVIGVIASLLRKRHDNDSEVTIEQIELAAMLTEEGSQESSHTESSTSSDDIQDDESNLVQNGQKVPEVPDYEDVVEPEEKGMVATSSSDNVEYDEEPPDDLCCSISAGLMEDPVMVVATGQTYDRESIETWFKNHDTDPLTNEVLKDKKLMTNYVVKRLIEDWMEDHKK